MTAPPVRAALVGYGYWGVRLLGIAGRVEPLDVAAVVDARAGSPGFAAPTAVPCAADLDATLADGAVEAVLVTVPSAGHADVVARALRAGKHVFVEKPLAVRGGDARALVELARERGLMLAVDHQYWWSPEVAALGAALAAGSVGRVVAISVQRVAPGPVRQDVDAWWDLACHDLATLTRVGLLTPDIAESFRPRSCVAVPDGGVAGCVVLSACRPDGVELWVHACWMSSIHRRRLVVAGTTGSLCLEEDTDELSLWLVRGGKRQLLSRTVKSNRGTPVECALAEFARGVRGTPDLRGAEDAVAVVRILERLDGARRTVPAIVAGSGCWL